MSLLVPRLPSSLGVCSSIVIGLDDQPFAINVHPAVIYVIPTAPKPRGSWGKLGEVAEGDRLLARLGARLMGVVREDWEVCSMGRLVGKPEARLMGKVVENLLVVKLGDSSGVESLVVSLAVGKPMDKPVASSADRPEHKQGGSLADSLADSLETAKVKDKPEDKPEGRRGRVTIWIWPGRLWRNVKRSTSGSSSGSGGSGTTSLGSTSSGSSAQSLTSTILEPCKSLLLDVSVDLLGLNINIDLYLHLAGLLDGVGGLLNSLLGGDRSRPTTMTQRYRDICGTSFTTLGPGRNVTATSPTDCLQQCEIDAILATVQLGTLNDCLGATLDRGIAIDNCLYFIGSDTDILDLHMAINTDDSDSFCKSC
ncbi:hypothetical protein B0T26DRAFT_670947 [Lasiosphaeria miniovina]|uniref:Uncharacterized protein n=1 Tax=Lasiosphaeria miniovina TaxID=1954250 RepID=A0AA40BI61_9PEZI|nr:uncharacterized protein B0T26DRAFT_670947 [Lasiosphaeria miniovina]KAK0734687.1 hypothetical protein B0T26DRAFT_670947 [Lasiosphaeria miniovina]